MAIKPEALLEHKEFVEAIARRLVLDDSGADDVAQQTWLAALEHPPRHTRSIRGWLAKIARNVVLMGRRADESRLQREKVAANAEAVPSAVESYDRIVTVRRVAEALIALDEPYRHTILLRFYEGKTPREIAESLNLPVETVRTRLKRGLAKLRERLDREFGDRGAWCLALAHIAGIQLKTAAAGITASSPALISGVVTMCTNVYFIVVSLAVVAVGIGFFSLWPDEVSDNVDTPLVVVEDSGGEVESLEQDDSANADRIPVNPAVGQGEVGPVEQNIFAGRFVEKAGMSVAGVKIFVGEINPKLIGVSGLDGTFSVAVDMGSSKKQREFALRARKEWYGTKRWKAVAKVGKTVHLGDMVLGPGGRVSGRIVDSAGIGIGSTRVCCTDTSDFHLYRYMGPEVRTGRYIDMPHLPNSRLLGAKAVTDENGRFTVMGVPVGEVRVWAGSANAFIGHSDPVVINHKQVTSNVVVVLNRVENKHRVEGVVLSHAGEPYAQVKLSAEYRFFEDGESQTCTYGISINQLGLFTFLTSSKDPFSLIMTDLNNRYDKVLLESVKPGSVDLILQFNFGGAIIKSAPGEIADGDGGKGIIVGKVVSGDGPVVGAKVSLHRAVPSTEFCTVMGFYCRTEPHAIASVRSDVNGGFRIEIMDLQDEDESLPGGIAAEIFELEKKLDGKVPIVAQYFIRAEVEGLAPNDLGPIRVNSYSGERGLEVRLDSGGQIKGRVAVRQGASPGGIIIAISRGDGFPQTQRTGPGGTYFFENLTPGNWEIEQRDFEVVPNQPQEIQIGDRDLDDFPVPMRWDCVVRRGDTTRYDLILTEEKGNVLSGAIRIGDFPTTGFSYLLSCIDGVGFGSDIITGRLGEDGSFLVTKLLPGKYTIIIESEKGHWPGVMIGDEIQIEEGQNQWEFIPYVGKIAIKSDSTVDEDITKVFYEWRGAGSLGARFFLQPEALSGTVPLTVPAGQGKLILIRKRDSNGRLAREVFAELNIPEGGTESLRMN